MAAQWYDLLFETRDALVQAAFWAAEALASSCRVYAIQKFSFRVTKSHYSN